MKKILIVVLLVILIPYVFVTIFIKDEEIKFIYHSNMVVRVKRSDTGVIEKIPLEEYTIGVLAGEMPVTFELEALKSQALAARSYVLKKMEYNIKKDYDIIDTPANQVYLDDKELRQAWGNSYEDKINKIKTAIKETTGEYIAYNGSVIEAFFFSTSAGATENSEDVFITALPYLRSVSSVWDEISPVYNDYEIFSLETFYNKLKLPYSKELNVEVLKKTKNGLIKKLKINGQTMSGDTFVARLNLRSNYITIYQLDNQIKVATKGYGHGVGMSQYGAQGMAKEGYTYDQIIKHYYQGVEIKKI